MKEEFIKQILEDIYMIDPSLKNQEKQLIKIIKEFEASQPDTNFDEKFAQALKQELLTRIRDMEENKTSFSAKKIIFNFNFMKKAYYVAGGALVCALLVIPIMSYLNKNSSRNIQEEFKVSFAPEIKDVGRNAFGSLVSSSQNVPAAERAAADQSAEVVGLGGGGGGGVATVPLAGKMIAPYPEMIKYNYIYKGDEIEFPKEDLLVYKKIINKEAGKNLARAFNFDLGLIDLRKFSNLGVDHISLSEDREFGYNIYFNLIENIVSISNNWQRWPQPSANCFDEECFQRNRLTINDVPGDSTLFSIAENFLKEYNISTTSYGKPEVMDQWRKSYEMMTDKEHAYIPEMMQVVYPLLIGGKKTYDDFGNFEGLMVDVDIRNMKAAGVRGMSLQEYEASNYELEKDVDKIVKVAESGGFFYSYPVANPDKVIDIELGTPTVELVRHWQYNSNTGLGDSLYVPAFVFPIISESEESYQNRKNVVVPIVKEILEERRSETNPGIPEPMPLLRTQEEVAPNAESGIMIKEGVDVNE